MPENLNIFLLMGQSNMSGRGKLEGVQELTHPDIYMYRDDQWQAAREPLHDDKPEIAGACLGMSFAMSVVEEIGPVGLVPCAVGGSPLRRWMPGEDLYEAALKVAKPALGNGTLSGILWHQGEHDSCVTEYAETYTERFIEMITSFKTALSAPDVPVISGQLGPFLKDFEKTVHYQSVNQQLRDLQQHVDNYASVSADGLSCIGDNLHFNTASLREFGERYAKQFLKMQTN